MYGQTEASPRISYIELKDLIKKPDSVGKVIPGGKIILSKKNQGKLYIMEKIFIRVMLTKEVTQKKYLILKI